MSGVSATGIWPDARAQTLRGAQGCVDS